jgi:hypothetical protein
MILRCEMKLAHRLAVVWFLVKKPPEVENVRPETLSFRDARYRAMGQHSSYHDGI